MPFIDTHCHFDFPAFNQDREVLWHQARALGVNQLIIPGVYPEQWLAVEKLCESVEGWFFSVGVHPWWLDSLVKNRADIDELDQCFSHWVSRYKASQYKTHERNHHQQEIFQQEVSQQERSQQRSTQNGASKCIAWGECGLDASIPTPMAMQEAVLSLQLSYAKALSLPVILHCYKAHNELIRQLKKSALTSGGVVHGFSGSLDLALSYWRLGFCLGIGGVITYERAQKTRATVRRLPIEAILLETDAPDMPLHGQQGKRNQPANILTIAETLASLRGELVETIAEQTQANAQRIFSFM